MIDLFLEIPVSDSSHPLANTPIRGPFGVEAVIVGIYDSGRIDAKITKSHRHYHENDRLVWVSDQIIIRGE